MKEKKEKRIVNPNVIIKIFLPQRNVHLNCQEKVFMTKW